MMNISSRCEYGCRAVLELASHDPSREPLTIEAIAERRHIPEKFLVHILLQLKRAGIVRSMRGSKGGYLLAQPPDAISLFNVVQAIDGPIFQPLPEDDTGSRDFVSAWRDVTGTITRVLSETSIAQVMSNALSGSMYHI